MTDRNWDDKNIESGDRITASEWIKHIVDHDRLSDATMNTDTDVNGNAWVVDEGTMVSDLATKVPTQQSVKAYVDSSVSEIGIKDACAVVTDVALPANTAAGSGVGKTLTMDAVGILTIDGVNTVLNNRILVKDEAAGVNNGIYDVTTEGDGATAAVLTRATDFDEDTEVFFKTFTFIESGTVNSNNGFTLTTADPITVDTTALTFTQTSGAGQIIAGTGLTKTGNTLDVVGGTGITANADDISHDAHTGDVTGATALTIADDAVTYAKMQDVSATDKLLGRSSTGAGAVEEIACTAAGRAILDDADVVAQRTTLGAAASGANSDITELSGITTDLSVAQGGTGASSAAGAKTNLGFMTGVVDDTSPQLGGVLDSNAHQILWSKGVDVASASDLWLGRDGNYFDITGTTTINTIRGSAAGTIVMLHFDDALTLTHNAADLILPSAVNITTAAGDEAMFVVYSEGYWRCVSYTRADGSALVSYKPGGADVAVLDGGTGASSAAGAKTNLGFMTGVVDDTSPQLGGVLDSNSKQVRWSKGADVASAAALPVLADGNYFDVTGTNTITSINTLEIGTVVILHFDDALTLTHNATDLILPGGANITTSAGDEAIFVEYAAGDWRCISYLEASGEANLFEEVSNVIREKSAGGYDNDFVIGSPQLADDVHPEHDMRMFFDKSKGAFRAGWVTGGEWDDANVGDYSHAEGENTTASGTGAHAGGKYSNAYLNYQHSFASGQFSTSGDAQSSRVVVMRETTDATQTELTIGGGTPGVTTRLCFPAASTTWAFHIMIAAREDATHDSGIYEIKGGIKLDGVNGAVMVGAITNTTIAEDQAAWAVTAVAIGIDEALVVKVTGEAAKTIHWAANVELVEVG